MIYNVTIVEMRPDIKLVDLVRKKLVNFHLYMHKITFVNERNTKMLPFGRVLDKNK